jgi:hypothetical protein
MGSACVLLQATPVFVHPGRGARPVSWGLSCFRFGLYRVAGKSDPGFLFLVPVTFAGRAHFLFSKRFLSGQGGTG